ncbi:MAG: 50S ribosomal protein L11 [Candidatus Diapherotrites archaeon]
MPEVSVLIDGGKATAAAPLGPALGPMGVDIGAVVAKINEKTKDFSGMKVPVKVIIDSTNKSFEIKVGSPPVSALIKKELNIKKAGTDHKVDHAGNLTIEQALKIAKMKIDNLISYTMKSAMKEIAGTCRSMSVTIDGKSPAEFSADVNAGKYDSVLQ